MKHSKWSVRSLIRQDGGMKFDKEEIHLRRAYRGEFITENDSVVGINLGGDHCAEHEVGISPLAEAFGLDQEKIGLDKFRITKDPGLFTTTGTVYGKKVLIAAFHAQWSNVFTEMKQRGQNTKDIAAYCRILPNTEDEGFTAAWDENSFAILAQGKESISYLTSILNALKENDLCLMLAGPNTPFGTAGLCLIRYSAFSDEEKDEMVQKDLDRKKLLAAAEKTKIAKKLEKAGLRYYALAPQWTNYFKKPKFQSKYSVIFFLNPQQQDKYNSGWFTVEDLLQWIKGTGPVVK